MVAFFAWYCCSRKIWKICNRRLLWMNKTTPLVFTELLCCIHTHSITILFFFKHSWPCKQFLCHTFVFFCSSFSLPVRLQLEFNGQAHLALTQFSQMENKASFSSHLFHGRNKPFACSVWFSFAHSLGWLVSRAPIHQTFLTNELLQQHTLRRSFYISWITHLPLFHVMHSFVSKCSRCVSVYVKQAIATPLCMLGQFLIKTLSCNGFCSLCMSNLLLFFEWHKETGCHHVEGGGKNYYKKNNKKHAKEFQVNIDF